MKRRYIKWTDDEIKFLKENYYNYGPKEMSKLMTNHLRWEISTKARKLGLEFKNKCNPLTEEEVRILERYYPTEGQKIIKRFQNRTWKQIKQAATYRGIKIERIQKPWPKEEDEIVYLFYLEHRGHSMKDTRTLQKLLKEKGYFRGLRSIRMRLANFEFLIDGGGLSHTAIQSKEVVNN